MGKLLVAALIGLSVIGTELYSQATKEIPKTQAAEQNSVKLLLPPALYAVPGTELNVYFDNIVLVQDIKDWNFDVDCSYGRQDMDRWSYTPGNKDLEIGNFPLKIKIYDASSKLIAEASTTVFVSPQDAGKDKNISVLLVGDSLTDQPIYPQELFKLFRNPGNPAVKFIGTHTGGGKPPAEDVPSLEGYGGWTWGCFCSKYIEKPLDPYAYRRGSSPFVFLKDGNPVLDFKTYCDKKNEGKSPDFITVFLGINDIFAADDTNIETKIDTISKNADILLSEFRKTGPYTKIGIVLTPPPANTQDAFGKGYKCDYNRWQYRKNQQRYVERLMKKFGGREKENLFLIPVYVNIDCVNNYPKEEEQINARNPKKILRDSNGVHPAKEGYLQIADSFYAWFKYELNNK